MVGIEVDRSVGLTIFKQMLSRRRNVAFVAEEAARPIHQLAPIGAGLMHCTEYVHVVPGIGERFGLLAVVAVAQRAIVLGLAKALAKAALRCWRHICGRRRRRRRCCSLLPLL